MSDYLQQIEEAYGKCRGRWSMLSAIDWDLALQWEKMGVPVHIVIRAIDDCCRRFKAASNPGKINTLRYFEQAVNSEFARWIQSRVGSAPNPANGPEIVEEKESEVALKRCSLIIEKFEAAAAVRLDLNDLLREVVQSVRSISIMIENGELDAADSAMEKTRLSFESSLVQMSEDTDVILTAIQSRHPEYANIFGAYNRLLVKSLLELLDLPPLRFIEF